MPGASETEPRTLDLDNASPHCSLLSPPYQAPASTAWLPWPVPPRSLASSPLTELAGTEPCTRGPGITDRGSTRCHAWSAGLH